MNLRALSALTATLSNSGKASLDALALPQISKSSSSGISSTASPVHVSTSRSMAVVNITEVCPLQYRQHSERSCAGQLLAAAVAHIDAELWLRFQPLASALIDRVSRLGHAFVAGRRPGCRWARAQRRTGKELRHCRAAVADESSPEAPSLQFVQGFHDLRSWHERLRHELAVELSGLRDAVRIRRNACTPVQI